MSTNPDLQDREPKVVAFVAELMETDPCACFARIEHLQTLPREDQPFMSFLEVLVELPDTASVLVERLGNRQEMTRLLAQSGDSEASKSFQAALDGGNAWTRLAFGKGRKGAYRKATHRPMFGKALSAYLLRAKANNGPLGVATNSWRTALSNIEGVPSFGRLARFNYLERICLLGIAGSPDEYIRSGGGPERGFEMIFGASDNMIIDGTRMLRSLIERTGNPHSLFALETILCQMQKDRFRHCFEQLFRSPFSDEAVREAVECYRNARSSR